MNAQRSLRPDDELLDVIEDFQGARAVLNSWQTPTTSHDQSATSRVRKPVSHTCKDEPQEELRTYGVGTSDPALRLKPQLAEMVKLVRPPRDEAPDHLKNLAKKSVVELRRLCTEQSVP